MEGYVEMWVNYFYKYQNKFLKIKDFILSINEYNEKENSFVKEKAYHIKYVSVLEVKGNVFTLQIDNKQGEVLYFRTEVEEALNWTDTIKLHKNRYEKFLDGYYVNNNSERLICLDEKSENYIFFSDYFDYVKVLLEQIETGLDKIKIDDNLDLFLNMQNTYLTKINSYCTEIDKFYFKLVPTEDDDLHIMNKSKEIKVLFEELKESIINCTYELNTCDIKTYIEDFKLSVNVKVKEMRVIINELSQLVENNMRMALLNSEETNKLNINTSKNKDIPSDELTLSNLLLENELLLITNKNLSEQTNIIKEFMNGSDY